MDTVKQRKISGLKPFKPGQSGNPKGRPRKDQSLLELIRSKLAETCQYDANKRTWMEALAEAEMKMALTDTAARRDLFDRLVGKPAEQMELSTKNDKPLFIGVLSKLRGHGNNEQT